MKTKLFMAALLSMGIMGTALGAANAPITIGVMADSEGILSFFESDSYASAMMAAVKNGGTPVDKTDPTQGVTGLSIGGHPVKFIFQGITPGDTALGATNAADALIQRGAQIIVGPAAGDEGTPIANYSKDHLNVTFVNGSSGAQDTTLNVRSPNFFRWNTEGAQWSAGLGSYAFNTLGWRKVVIVGDNYSFGYDTAAGFVADFCKQGGQIVKRLWPEREAKNYSSTIKAIKNLTDYDGLFVTIGGDSLDLFLTQAKKAKLDLRGKVIGSLFFGFLSDPALADVLSGVVLGNGFPYLPLNTPKYQQYLALWSSPNAYTLFFGNENVFSIGYFNAMDAVLLSLKASNGDLSNNQYLFRKHMSGLTLDAQIGKIKLDKNRQAIGPNFLYKININPDLSTSLQLIQTLQNVDEQFGGYFPSGSPAPTQTTPLCTGCAN